MYRCSPHLETHGFRVRYPRVHHVHVVAAGGAGRRGRSQGPHASGRRGRGDGRRAHAHAHAHHVEAGHAGSGRQAKRRPHEHGGVGGASRLLLLPALERAAASGEGRLLLDHRPHRWSSYEDHRILLRLFNTVSYAYLALHETLQEVQNFYEKKKMFFGTKVTSEAFLSISQNLKVTRLQGCKQTKPWTCWRNFDLSRSFERFFGVRSWLCCAPVDGQTKNVVK